MNEETSIQVNFSLRRKECPPFLLNNNSFPIHHPTGQTIEAPKHQAPTPTSHKHPKYSVVTYHRFALVSYAIASSCLQIEKKSFYH